MNMGDPYPYPAVSGTGFSRVLFSQACTWVLDPQYCQSSAWLPAFAYPGCGDWPLVSLAHVCQSFALARWSLSLPRLPVPLSLSPAGLARLPVPPSLPSQVTSTRTRTVPIPVTRAG